MKDLGTLGSSISAASGINASGQVAGTSKIAGDRINHACLWEKGAITDLGTLGGANSIAWGINTAGQIVGIAATQAGSHAFLWSDGMMRDLNQLIPPGSGWELTVAFSINDAGQIVGRGSYNGQALRSFLLTPNP